MTRIQGYGNAMTSTECTSAVGAETQPRDVTIGGHHCGKKF